MNDPARRRADAMNAAEENFAGARLWAATRAPYLTSALFALTALIHEDAPPRPSADEHWNVHLNPEATAAAPVPELGWWLLHHVSHLLRDHHARARPYAPHVGEPPPDSAHTDVERWVRAADAEVNDDLDDAPADAISPETLGLPDGLLAERYAALLDLIDPPPHLRPCARPPFTGPAATTELERELLARAVAADIQARGTAPGGWQRWAQSALHPEVNWRARLARLVRRGLSRAAGRVDYSYSRPSRRSAAAPSIVLPALIRPLPRVTVLVDTSGSIGRTALDQALSELDGVLRAAGSRWAEVICCDTRAYPAQRVRSAAHVELVGGGGTDLRPGFTAAQATGADLLVVLTDGDTPWPDRRPRPYVVVCLFGDDHDAPGWASTVRLFEDGHDAPDRAGTVRQP
ncbi:VWA-like domain-containing protein [Nonomuraea sp. NPDC050404]|uniref:vWA domain-containing protein n=1 Tax=Nonomuraea sp. NPDC050404 TaxID=3155783 RepID=UPI0033D8E64C